MNISRMLGTSLVAFFGWSSAEALADTVDNPGMVTFTIQAGSSAQIGTAMPLTFGGSTPPSSVSGTVDSQGNITIPQASVVFQPILIMFGTFTATVTPMATADASGTINPVTGVATATFALEFDLSGLFIPPGCRVPAVTLSMSSSLGTAYDMTTGLVTMVDNTFAVPASDGCGSLGSIIDSQFGLPSASGNNTATIVFSATPILVGS